MAVVAEAQAYIEMWATGTDNAKAMREKWGGAACRAWLPLCGTSSPVLKILRKGAPNFPASVRYISAQMERACAGAGNESGELLRDIVRTWAMGTFRPPASNRASTIARVLYAASASHGTLFAGIAARAKTGHLHELIRSFVAGVTGNSACMVWAMQSKIAYPYGDAVWAMLQKIVRRSSPVNTTLPVAFATTIFAYPLISAKRLKAVYVGLPKADRDTVDGVVAHRRLASTVCARPLSTADDQTHLPPVWVPRCTVCGLAGVRLDLDTGGAECTKCGSQAVTAQLVNNNTVTDGTGAEQRLCSACGIIIAKVSYVGAKGMCSSCACTPTDTLGCVVCGKVATRRAIADHTVVYGTCEDHTGLFHYSQPLEDIVTALRARCA